MPRKSPSDAPLDELELKRIVAKLARGGNMPACRFYFETWIRLASEGVADGSDALLESGPESFHASVVELALVVGESVTAEFLPQRHHLVQPDDVDRLAHLSPGDGTGDGTARAHAALLAHLTLGNMRGRACFLGLRWAVLGSNQ